MENKIIGMPELLEEKEKLRNIIQSSIDDFIEKTKIFPIVKVIDTETRVRCGLNRSIEIKVTVEI